MREKMLLDKIANFENLFGAFRDCSKGKRSKCGYQNFLFNYGEKLKFIEEELRQTKKFNWGSYRKFYVYDPKKRIVMAAPFRDRVVHTAIHRVLMPIIDEKLGFHTFACRDGKGNRNAVIRLYNQLRLMGKERYCIKLDVSQYFASIVHKKLYGDFMKELPDDSVSDLLWSLIISYPEYSSLGRGIPIGNLTSQLFANFYLSEIDKFATQLLEVDFYSEKWSKKSAYLRYMDDMVLITKKKELAIEIADKVVSRAKNALGLDIPPRKYVVLANDPIPFLGFVVDSNGYRPLRRNERKFKNKIIRLRKKGADLSHRMRVMQSYEAWQDLSI